MINIGIIIRQKMASYCDFIWYEWRFALKSNLN